MKHGLPVAIAVAAVAVGLAGCHTTKYVDAKTIEQQITKTVSDQTEYKPTDVKCPTDVPANVGAKFKCNFTGPDGAYTAYVKVTKVEGEHLEFDFKSQLSSDPPPSS